MKTLALMEGIDPQDSKAIATMLDNMCRHRIDELRGMLDAARMNPRVVQASPVEKPETVLEIKGA